MNANFETLWLVRMGPHQKNVSCHMKKFWPGIRKTLGRTVYPLSGQENCFNLATLGLKQLFSFPPIGKTNVLPLVFLCLAKFFHMTGIYIPAKTVFAINLKTIDWRVVYYVYLSLAQLFWPKKCTKCICTINNFWNKAKTIFAHWGLSSISMDFVYWDTCI